MPTIDASTWGKANLWRMPSGEMCVRPGLRRIYTPSSRTIVGGFSVPLPETGEVFHYIFDIATSGTKDLRLRILDEDFQVFQILQLNVDCDPRGISYAIVQGQILIGSPDFPTLWGLLGSGHRLAAKFVPTTAQDDGFTRIDIQRGIITTWQNRPVICNGRNYYIGDASDFVIGNRIRSFIGFNVGVLPGIIYGIHQGAGGMLVAITSAGVWGLDSAAASVDIVGTSAAWRILNHAQATSYDSSCTIRGVTFALTQDGFMAVDAEQQDETALTQAYTPRVYGPRISLEDYRGARMFSGQVGPLVAAHELNAVHMTDFTSTIESWWTSRVTPTEFKLRGMLRDADGDDLLLCENGVFRVCGDFDGEVALSSAVATQPKGVLFGTIPGAPSNHRLVRHVHVAADVGAGGNMYAAVRGKPLPASGTAGVSDPEGMIIGTDVWGSSTKRYTSSSLQGVRFDFGESATRATDDVAIEVGADVCLTRISPAVDVEHSESAPKRPAKVAS